MVETSTYIVRCKRKPIFFKLLILTFHSIFLNLDVAHTFQPNKTCLENKAENETITCTNVLGFDTYIIINSSKLISVGLFPAAQVQGHLKTSVKTFAQKNWLLNKWCFVDVKLSFLSYIHFWYLRLQSRLHLNMGTSLRCSRSPTSSCRKQLFCWKVQSRERFVVCKKCWDISC